MNNNYIVFDVETTGLTPKGLNWRTDYMQFPHIVSIAWKTNLMNEPKEYIIKPDGWVIPDESIKIHGITNEYALENGNYIDPILELFYYAIQHAYNLIGHNVHFDTSIISANILRCSYNRDNLNQDIINEIIKTLENLLNKDRRICTMLKSIKFCGVGKFPSLEELYYTLFNETFEAHNAKNDVIATEKCYLKLIELGII